MTEADTLPSRGPALAGRIRGIVRRLIPPSVPSDPVPRDEERVSLYHHWRTVVAGASAGPLQDAGARASAVSPQPGRIDERTWSDLDLFDVFLQADRSAGVSGRQWLYDRLRSPGSSSMAPERFGELVRLLEADSRLQARFGSELGRLERRDAYYLPRLFLQPLPARPGYFRLLLAAPIASLGLVAATVAGASAALPALIVVAAVNIGLRLHFQRRIRMYAEPFRMLGALLRASRGLASLDVPALEPERAVLRDGCRRMGRFRRLSPLLGFEDDRETVLAVLFGYLDLFLLLTVNAFFHSLEDVRTHQDVAARLFELVGALDGALSVARWREDLPGWCEPRWLEEAGHLRAEALYHPLLAEPVPNDIEVRSGGVLVTGANMTGKSTFLRSLGVAVALGEAYGTCPATTFEAPSFRVMSIVDRADEIRAGKSYYLVEVERILELLRASGSSVPHLFIIDEIFRGTNRVDRVAASRAVLDYLDRGGDLVVASTHDIELADLLEGRWRFVHFRGRLTGGNLDFDHRIRDGVSRTRNALLLLEAAGYPPEIVEAARKGAAELEGAEGG